MKIKALFLFACFCLFPASGLEIDFPENSEVRTQYKDLIFGPITDINNFRQTYNEQTYYDQSVLVKSQEAAEASYLLFINEKSYDYPVVSIGAYIIKRDKINGQFIQAKVFLKDREDTFMRIFPDNDKSKIDLFLYGRKVYSDVPLPESFEDVLVNPANEVFVKTKGLIDWDLILNKGASLLYGNLIDMVNEIRSALPYLPDGDDGAMDADGRLVYIENLGPQSQGGLNCSGFVKWIVDGIIYPRTGSYLKISDLKIKRYNYRGDSMTNRYEEERDPFFGLDWTRNLAMAAWDKYDDPELFDVKNVSFLDYYEDIGYQADDIDLALYQLAVKEPGYFYLGSVNGDWGENPTLRQHYHVAAFFPFFDSDGQFEIVVMERNKEIGIDDFRKKYSGEYINLARIPVSEDFVPPEINKGLRLFR